MVNYIILYKKFVEHHVINFQENQFNYMVFHKFLT